MKANQGNVKHGSDYSGVIDYFFQYRISHSLLRNLCIHVIILWWYWNLLQFEYLYMPHLIRESERFGCVFAFPDVLMLARRRSLKKLSQGQRDFCVCFSSFPQYTLPSFLLNIILSAYEFFFSIQLKAQQYKEKALNCRRTPTACVRRKSRGVCSRHRAERCTFLGGKRVAVFLFLATEIQFQLLSGKKSEAQIWNIVFWLY